MFYMNFNGVDLPIRIKSVGGRGPLSQEIARATTAANGSLFVKRRRKEIPMPVEYTIDALDLEDLRLKVDELNDILDVDEPKPVIFSDEPNFTYYMILDGDSAWAEAYTRGQGVLNFVRLDPFKYDQAKIRTINNETIILLDANNAQPIFTVKFTSSATEFTISHLEQNKFVKVKYNFVSGDTLVIDLTKRKIFINGVIQMPAYVLSSSPFEFKRGSNTIASNPLGVASVSVEYKPRL